MNQWLNGRRGSATAAWNTQATSTSGAARRWERARTERLKLGGAQVGPNAQSPANWALRQIPAQSRKDTEALAAGSHDGASLRGGGTNCAAAQRRSEHRADGRGSQDSASAGVQVETAFRPPSPGWLG